MGMKQGKQKYGSTGVFLDYKMKEIKWNFDIPPQKQTDLLGRLMATRPQSVRIYERSLDTQGRQEVTGLEKEMVTVADSPIGSGPS